MYKDFFDAPQRPLKKSKPTPSTSKAKPTPKADATDKPAKRGVRFSESVKVKTIPSRHDIKMALKKGKGKAMTEEELEEEVTKELVAASSDEEDEGELDEEMSFGEGDEEELGLLDNEDLMDEDEEGEEEGSVEGSDGINEGQEAIERFKSELFDDEDEEREDSKSTSFLSLHDLDSTRVELQPLYTAKNLSKYERRLLALSDQIAALEQQNVGPKDWATLGEAQSRDRPTNSLLDEDLEFERMGKSAPVVTEETTKSIEDLIKQRILDVRITSFTCPALLRSSIVRTEQL